MGSADSEWHRDLLWWPVQALVFDVRIVTMLVDAGNSVCAYMQGQLWRGVGRRFTDNQWEDVLRGLQLGRRE